MLPKVVFSRTLDTVRGNARLADCSVAEEMRIFRVPIVVGGGTPYLPPATSHAPLDLVETRTFDSRVRYERYGRGSLGVPGHTSA